MGRVEEKVAVVTGAGRGQGRSHARMLAAEGADVIVIDACVDIETNGYPLARREDLDETVRLVEKEGRRAYPAVVDVRDRPGLAAAIADGTAELGGLDIVVANAGIAPLSGGAPVQAFADAVDVDLVGVINLVHASLPHLGAGASIIATGSLAAYLAATDSNGMQTGSQGEANPGGAGYSFAKQVVAHYVNDLALQLAPHRIRVNAVHPTNVNTDMLHSAPMYKIFRPDLENPTREDAELTFPMMNAMPIAYIEPEDVSEVVVFLASEGSRYMTGQQIRIDAGGLLKAVPWSKQ
ncbi:3-ketoacyl-ACP reductase [Mycobacteriaceae bacterium 1482268.1]|nr:3-ketoacyl-ACP reductase [Mycobacteriaceae bacterium 1482268.1]